jgi:UDP-glucose 4-epimerase
MAAALRTIAVTGVRGMVGRHVEAALTRAGIGCVGVDRSRWDLRRWASDDELDAILSNCDAVIHAGAAVPSPGHPVSTQDILDANVRACFCLGDWARKRGKALLFVSGATVYASLGKLGITEADPTTTRPESGLYGLSKFLGEQLLDCLSGHGLKLCALRPSSIYGAGMPETRMVAAMLGKARRGEAIQLKPPVADRINFIHAADVAEAAVAALTSGALGIFNLAGPDTVSIAELAQACVEVAAYGSVVLPDGGAGRGSLKYQLDYSKASAAFGFAPRVGLKEGLKRSLAGVL